MRLFIFTLSLTFLTLSLSSQTKESALDSKIERVTVYRDRADITRRASIDLEAGTHVLTLEGLPANLDTNSIRVDGTGSFTLLDVQTKDRYLNEVPESRLRELREEKENLERKIQRLEMELTRLSDQKQFLKAISKRVTDTPEKESTPAQTDPQTWASLLEFYATNMEALDDSSLKTQTRVNETKKELERVQQEIRQLGHKQKAEKVLSIAVEATQATSGTLSISYLVYGARWTPAYEIRADEANKTIELVYSAQVSQNTGEDWKNIQLSLSTAQPMIGGQAPELSPWYVNTRQEQAFADAAMPAAPASPRLMKTSMARENDAELAEALPMAQAEATVEQGTLAASFSVKALATIPADNTQSTHRIQSFTFPADYLTVLLPRLSENAYLRAKITNDSDFPLLSGKASVFLGNLFVTTTRLDTIAPTQSFDIDLGIDPDIEAEFTQITRERDEKGIFDKRERIRFAYKTEITNHNKHAIKLEVKDHIPFSQDEKIEVELIKPDTNKGNSANLDDLKVLTWERTLKPGEKIELPLEFTVSYPQGELIRGL